VSVLARLRRRSARAPRLAGPELIAAFAEAYPAARFAEIGANDGVQHDHLREHIFRHAWVGVMAEPVPYVFARLERNYADLDRVTTVNAAVTAQDGRLPFFWLRDADADERAGLPDWYDGIGSFSRGAVLSHAPQIPDVHDRLVEADVEALSFDSLLERAGLDAVDLLVIDTEGHDWAILRSVDLRRHRPRLIVYEHFHLDPGARSAARACAEHAGYATMEEGFDTFCLLPGEGDALDRAWARAKPGVPGVAKEDEPLALADTSVPLPPDAAERLRDDHPRLAGLRAAYPPAEHSRWAPERVGAFLDLRWFRGESLIMWHYREDPEGTLRRYRELAADVAARDDLGLLDRLAEDGAFGCWTFDVDGRTVSRDLLDSVAELNFLARTAGLDGKRVLDIGAGYGRLAHRAVEGATGVADWCCVDAIPESTFVCEYHLEHRGAMPPARVVPFNEIDGLTPGSFDVAVNVHSFPEMPLAAIEGWIALLERLDVPALMVVPNDEAKLESLEPDGSRRDFGELLARAGYVLAEHEQGPVDHRLLFRRS